MTTNNHPFTLRSEVPPPRCACDYEMLMAHSRRTKGQERKSLVAVALHAARFCDRHRHLWLEAHGL